MPVENVYGTIVGQNNDLNGLWDDALANYQARAENPRYIPTAEDQNPDSPDKLKRELLDPLETMWGAMTGHYPPVGPRPINPFAFHSTGFGGLEKVNKQTGDVEEVSPTNPPTRMNDQDRLRYQALLSDRNKLLGNAAIGTDDGLKQRLSELDDKISQFENQGSSPMPSAGGAIDWNNVGTQAPTPSSPAPFTATPFNFGADNGIQWPTTEPSAEEPQAPSNFIGTPGGANRFQAGPAAPAAAPLDYQTPAQVRADWKAGKINRDVAFKILRTKFGYK